MRQDATPARSSLDAFSAAKLDELTGRGLRRRLLATHRHAGAGASRDGQGMISFSCNDYLGLSQDPKVCAAAIRAVETYGAGAGASRLVTGNHPLYAELETRLARLKGTEAACVFGSGYLANTGIIPALVGEGDLVVLDALGHACMFAGARLSRAEIRTFRHNDAGDCRRVIRAHRRPGRHCLVLTEGVFSMDGDLAPLPELARAAEETDAWLMTDDAHGLGVLGGGRGSTAHWGEAGRVPLQMGTLSKAVGAYGGYLCASLPVIELIENRARSLIYSTALPPPVVAAAVAALDIIAGEPDRVAAPVRNARFFTRLAGLPEAASPIVPLIVGPPERALSASQALAEEGFLVVAIRPPTVPEGTSRLRFTFSAAHREEDIRGLVGALGELGLVPPS